MYGRQACQASWAAVNNTPAALGFGLLVYPVDLDAHSSELVPALARKCIVDPRISQAPYQGDM